MAAQKKPTPGQLIKKCDELFSKIVRARGCCESGRPEHNGNHQCAHGFSRRYTAVRWEAWNAFCFCAGCHVFFTHRPLEWEAWLRDRWGDELYVKRARLAMAVQPKPDRDVLHDRLKSEWDAIREAA